MQEASSAVGRSRTARGRPQRFVAAPGRRLEIERAACAHPACPVNTPKYVSLTPSLPSDPTSTGPETPRPAAACHHSGPSLQYDSPRPPALRATNGRFLRNRQCLSLHPHPPKSDHHRQQHRHLQRVRPSEAAIYLVETAIHLRAHFAKPTVHLRVHFPKPVAHLRP